VSYFTGTSETYTGKYKFINVLTGISKTRRANTHRGKKTKRNNKTSTVEKLKVWEGRKIHAENTSHIQTFQAI